jgi:putative heme iron utilization protein
MKPDPAFNARRAAKKLLREGRSGAMATLMNGSGGPYCSLVNVATASDGAPLLLISNLALHTKNILADGRVSLMLDERKDADPLEGARVMLMGKAAAADAAAARPAYLRRHPEAKTFVDFPDFGFYRIEIERAHLVAGFGRIVDLNAGDILTGLTDAAPLIEAEGGAIDHMNADHAGALRLYATRLLGAPDGDWRCVGLNPDGIELQRERMGLWLPFPQRVISPGSLRAMLRDLAEQARAR